MDEAASPLEARIRELEVKSRITDSVDDLMTRVQDLEAMVKTAKYVASVCAGLVSIIGIGLAAGIAVMSERVRSAEVALVKAEGATATMSNKLSDAKANVADTLVNAKGVLSDAKEIERQNQTTRGLTQTLLLEVNEKINETKRKSANDTADGVADLKSLPIGPIIESIQRDLGTLKSNVNQIAVKTDFISVTPRNSKDPSNFRITVGNTTFDHPEGGNLNVQKSGFPCFALNAWPNSVNMTCFPR